MASGIRVGISNVFKLPAIIYSVVASLLLAAMFAPEIELGTAPVLLTVLIDRSASMQGVNGTESSSAVTHALNVLPTDSQAEVIAFAEKTNLIAALAPVAAARESAFLRSADENQFRQVSTQSTTNVENAVDFALRNSTHSAPTRSQAKKAILLLSDGIETTGDASVSMRLAKDAGVPVFFIQPRQPTGVDAQVSELQHSLVARIGDRVTVTASLATNTALSAQVHLYVDDKLVASETTQLRENTPQEIAFNYVPEQTGPASLRVQIDVPGDTRLENNTVTSSLNVIGPPNVIYVSQSPTPPLAESLRQGGFRVNKISPDKTSFAFAEASANSVIVIDNVTATDLSQSAVDALKLAVAKRGAGLIVLGGANAFGNGAYRHSTLEELLPVTSESGLPRPHAAVLFLIDKSGSMEGDPSEVSRLALARRAVSETAKTLTSSDVVGLVAFDVSSQWLLPLATTASPELALTHAASAMRANGGTRLRAAIENAVDALGNTDTPSRILVLVTDGFAENEKFDDLAKTLLAKNTVLIALAVGADADTAPLTSLAVATGGHAAHVVDTLALPRLMRQEVERQRKAIELGNVRVEVDRALPFIPSSTRWPAISGYNIVKSKPDALTYLHAPQGDPLFVTRAFGVGRVVVLPAGLEAWALQWQLWPNWSQFAGGLAQWAAGSADPASLNVEIRDTKDGFDIHLNALGNDNHWAHEVRGLARIGEPGGQTLTAALETTVPGRYYAHVVASHPGTYVVSVEFGAFNLVRHFTHQTRQEFASVRVGTDNFRRWEAQQLAQAWSAEALAARIGSASVSTRPALLTSAALLYLLLMAIQRGWLSSFPARLRFTQQEHKTP